MCTRSSQRSFIGDSTHTGREDQIMTLKCSSEFYFHSNTCIRTGKNEFLNLLTILTLHTDPQNLKSKKPMLTKVI